MKIVPTNESPDEVEVPVEKIYQCYICNDSGEVNDPQWDNDSHQYINTGDTKKCVCKLDDDRYEPETI